jgi:hypothetical protein
VQRASYFQSFVLPWQNTFYLMFCRGKIFSVSCFAVAKNFSSHVLLQQNKGIKQFERTISWA